MWVPRKVTMPDIAKKLGLSVKTVESAIRKWKTVI